jgi:glycosyltransferase involved in cell wall biosynthesis
MQKENAPICCIFNYAPHYRTEIYLKVEAALLCDFYFGSSTASKIKRMDYNLFREVPKELIYIPLFSHFNWLKGAVSLVFKPYDAYLMTGEPYCLSTWCILMLNRLVGKKTFLWSHGWYGRENKLKVLFKKFFFNLSHGVFLYGHYAQRLMLKEGIKSEKLKVVYNSLYYSQQKLLRNKLKRTDVYKKQFKNEKPTIIFIGRIEEKKKLDQLFQALKIAKERKSVLFNICLVGGGMALNNMKQLVSSMKLDDDIWFYGACYDEEIISELIYNADVCVSPGEVGLTAIHSLSYGTPVITHNDFSAQMPEFEVVEEGKTGNFFEKNNVDSLLNTLENWFKRFPLKSSEVSDACYQIIDEKYNPYIQVKILKDYLESSTN